MRIVLRPSITTARRRGSAALWAWPGLLLLTLATRLPLQSDWLYHWDSINFALALERFDIAQGQPHAPGYLLYVLAGRGAAALTGDAQRGYVLLAMLGSALAAIALFDLGRRLWDVQTGWLAALLLLFSPLFWFYGEVALPHTLDALAVIGAATLSWRVAQGEQRLALPLALWLGLAGGMRQQTLVFMLPLALVAGWRAPWRWRIAALTALTLTVLLWLIPLLQLSGGLGRYLAIVGSYSATFDRPTSVLLGASWQGLQHNLDKLARYTLWGWAGGLALLPGLLVRLVSGPHPRLRSPLSRFAGEGLVRMTRLSRRNRGWGLPMFGEGAGGAGLSIAGLFALWMLPCLLFYSLIHMGQQGLIFVYLPALLLLSARGGALALERWRWGAALPALALLVNLALYLAAPVELLPGRFKVLSQATIRRHDAEIAAQIEAVRRDLPPGALLLADEWRFPQYYLPEVALLPYRHPDDETPVAIELDATQQAQLAQATALAWYEPTLDGYNRAPEQTTLAAERQGVRLRVLTRTADQRFYVTSSGFGVER
jgi:4-amino-4-deoxy-L-arabinose transferase-like glycosyltransferase